MKIGNVEIKNNLFLAPMAGVSDFAFRKICRDFGAGASTTEMVSAKGLIYGDRTTKEKLSKLSEEEFLNECENSYLKKEFLKDNKEFLFNKTASLLISEEKSPKIVQIFGNEPEFMAKACQHELLKDFDIIDINMGCPAPKIIKNEDGSKLMENFDLAREIIISCKKATTKPITVKFRKGFKKDVATKFAKMCEEAGADAIIIHGRLASEGYSGKVDYECIRAVKNAVKIPVIGSGDVVDISSYKKMLETGVDGVMIGRGALGKPYIFSEISGGGKIQDENRVKFDCAIKHIELLRKYYKDEFIVSYLKKHLLWYVSGTTKKELKVKLSLSNSLDDCIQILKNILL